MVQRYPAIAFTALAIVPIYLILGLCWLLRVPFEQLRPLKILFAFTPLLSMIMVLSANNEKARMNQIFSKWINRSSSPKWYFMGILFIPLVGLFSMLVYYFISGTYISGHDFSSISNFLALSIPLFLFPGITEEFAWRGFLYDHLRHRFNLSLSAALVGIVWGLWHSFDFIIGNWKFSLPMLLGFSIYILSLSILICYFFEQSQQNILVAMLTHYSANAMIAFTPLWKGDNIMVFIFISLLAFCALMIILFKPGNKLGLTPYNIPNLSDQDL